MPTVLAAFEHASQGFHNLCLRTPRPALTGKIVTVKPERGIGGAAIRKRVADEFRKSFQVGHVSAITAKDPVSETSADLPAALGELDGARAEALQEGYAEPSDLAIENARKLLAPIHESHPAHIEVYPDMEGDIAIYVSPGPRRSVEVICKRDGGAMCLVNLNGLHRRAIYDSADMLPDAFLREALDDL